MNGPDKQPPAAQMRIELLMAGWRQAGTNLWCSPGGVHLVDIVFCWRMMWHVGPEGKTVNRG